MLLLVLLLAILDPTRPLTPEAAEPANPCLCALSDQDICALEMGTCVCITHSGWHAFRVSTADGGPCDQVTFSDSYGD